MSLLLSPMYKSRQDSEQRKKQEFMGSNFHQQQSSGLMRYGSAPSSLLESLVDANNGGYEDFRYPRPSSPGVDVILEKFMSSCNGSAGDSEFGGKLMKQEATDLVPGYSTSPHMVYEAPQTQHPDLASSVTNMNSSSMQAGMGARNCSNLIRQSSSPAGLFSNLNDDTGFGEMRELGNHRADINALKGETVALTSRMHNYTNFSNGSSSSSRLMPQACGMGSQTQNTGVSNGNKRSYMPGFLDDSWQNSGFNSLKRSSREDMGNTYLGFNSLESQNGNSGNRTTLAHQYSLPNTSVEMAAVDKFLQFQESVPCKIRAKRGFATHPRSIAERMRRTRISDRMKKLQDLFPDMDKQTNTADMLDLAVEYIKDLQKRVNKLTDTRAKCTCSNKTKQYANP